MAKAQFVGDGTEFVASYYGVPNRDLSGEEYDALSDEQRVAVLTTKDSKSRLLFRVTGATAEREALGLVEPAAVAAPSRRRRAPEVVEPAPEQGPVTSEADTAPVEGGE